jgi:UDP-N-acetylmuramate--alanine ligase
VSGSDLKESDLTGRLRAMGAGVQIGHAAANITPDMDVVVVSNAVPDTNPEIIRARELKIPIIPRAQILNDLMRLKQGIAIAGTHGKTTTSSMTAWTLAEAGLDPTLIIGGVLNNLNQGARMGKGEYFVVEACEAYSSFLHLTPNLLAVTNIDDDHLENYGSRGALDDAFVEFINRVPFWGAAVLNLDDAGIRQVLPRIFKRVVTYGFDPAAELRAAEWESRDLRQEFTVLRGGERLGRIRLQIPGRFNVSNALAAAGLALECGVPFEQISKALGAFSGVRRRFQRKGESSGIVVVDDYAHHPTEIAATLAAARSLAPRRVVAVFQPHLFSRTQRLYKAFAAALAAADAVYLADIYPARELPIPGVSSQLIADQMRLDGHPISGGPVAAKELVPMLTRELRAGDLCLTIGAGNIWEIGEAVLNLLAKQGASHVL